jgi:hypothetical protein
MSDNPNTLGRYEPDPLEPETTYTRSQIRNRRILFWLGIFVWVVILMIPLSVFMLSILGEASFSVPGNYPGNEVRIWMVMELDERGIAYSRPSIADRTDDSLSVQTTVRYMLWQGQGEHIQYCQVYERDDGDRWTTSSNYEGPCS